MTETEEGNQLEENSDGADSGSHKDSAHDNTMTEPRIRRIQWKRLLVYGLLPGIALLLALGAGYAKWLISAAEYNPSANIEAARAATDGTIAMLSYQHDTADKDLLAASDRLTGEFKDSYKSLINDVVIPGAREQKISATATVPASAPVSASDNHAVVMLFVDQTTTIGDDPGPTTASTVRVTLDKVDGRWHISKFEPI